MGFTASPRFGDELLPLTLRAHALAASLPRPPLQPRVVAAAESTADKHPALPLQPAQLPPPQRHALSLPPLPAPPPHAPPLLAPPLSALKASAPPAPAVSAPWQPPVACAAWGAPPVDFITAPPPNASSEGGAPNALHAASPSRAAVFVSGELREWASDAAFGAGHAAHLVSPLVADGYAVDVIFCFEDTPAARAAAAAAFAPLGATAAAGAASARSYFFDPPAAPPSFNGAGYTNGHWRQFARIAACRACAGPPDAWARFVVVRPDLLVQAPLPPASSLDPAALHARVRSAVNLPGGGALRDAHFSYHFGSLDCWDAGLPDVPAGAPPFVLPDDQLAVFAAGPPADAYFGAIDFYLAGGAAACGRRPPPPPRPDSPTLRNYIELRLGDALACAGIPVVPLALPARLAKHKNFGPCYAFGWAGTPGCEGTQAHMCGP